MTSNNLSKKARENLYRQKNRKSDSVAGKNRDCFDCSEDVYPSAVPVDRF